MWPAERASSKLGCAIVCVMAASGQPVRDTMSPAHRVCSNLQHTGTTSQDSASWCGEQAAIW